DDPESVVLRQPRPIVRKSQLDVVSAAHIREIRVRPGVGEPPVLPNRLALQIWSEIGERVAGGVIVELILPHEGAQRKQRMRAEQMRPRGSNVKCADFGVLILRSRRQAIGTKAAIVHHHSRPCRGVLPIEGIRRLEPGPRVAQIEIDGDGLKSIRSNRFAWFPRSCITVNSGPSRNRRVPIPLAEIKLPHDFPPYARLKPALLVPNSPQDVSIWPCGMFSPR